MDTQTVIKIGGFYNLAFLVFHAMFWKIFKWHNELPKLTHINGAIMQVLNLCLMFYFLLFGISWKKRLIFRTQDIEVPTALDL